MSIHWGCMLLYCASEFGHKEAYHFYKCHIYIYEPCSDECCKKEIQAAGAAQDEGTLTEALAQL